MNWIAFITPRQADEFSREKSLTKHPYARISSIEEFPSTFNSDPESVGRIEIITDEQKKAHRKLQEANLQRQFKLNL